MSVAASVAAALSDDRRQELALEVLAGIEPVAQIAAREQVSRPFLYRQKHRAEAALNRAFAPTVNDPAVLFYLPVTAAWLDQLVVSLVLICHSSYRGVIRFFWEVLDTSISLGGSVALAERPRFSVSLVPHEHRPELPHDRL